VAVVVDRHAAEGGGAARLLDPGPVPRPDGWFRWVHEPQTPAELGALRQSFDRGRPFGETVWQRRTAARLGLESTFQPRGRPRKKK